MRIEIESDFDTKHITETIIARVVDRLSFDAKEETRRAVAAQIDAEIAKQIRAQVALCIQELRIGESGDTFKEYVEKRLLGKRTDPYTGSQQVSRLQRAIDSVIESSVQEWFKEIAAPHLQEMKETIKSRFSSMVFDAIGLRR